MNSIFVERKNEGRKPEKKLEPWEDSILCLETSTKNVVQEFSLTTSITMCTV